MRREFVIEIHAMQTPYARNIRSIICQSWEVYNQIIGNCRCLTSVQRISEQPTKIISIQSRLTIHLTTYREAVRCLPLLAMPNTITITYPTFKSAHFIQPTGGISGTPFHSYRDCNFAF